MSTKLTRLYKNKLRRKGDVNIVDENEGLKTDHELSLPEEFPAGEGDDSQNTKPGLGPLRIEGVSKNSGMIAIYPSDYAAEEIRNHFNGVPNLEGKKQLHVTLVYLGKELTEEQWQIAEDVCDLVADIHDGMWCKTQGIGVFDQDNDGRPFYCSVDAPGLAAMRTDLVEELGKRGIEVPSDYDFTPHMTIAYLADLEKIDLDKGSPNVKWECGEICLVRGDEILHTSTLAGLEKTAGGFGFDLSELATPSKGDGFAQPDAPLSENTQEDPDLKLGDVEEPYSMGDGALNVRFDDALDPEKEYNITKGAVPKPLSPPPDYEHSDQVKKEVNDEMSKWPQETKVLTDMYLEQGAEPMVEEDEAPARSDDIWDNTPNDTVDAAVSNCLGMPVTLVSVLSEINSAMASGTGEPEPVTGPVADKVLELYNYSYWLRNDEEEGLVLLTAWGDGSDDRGVNNLSAETGVYDDPVQLSRLILQDIVSQSLAQEPGITGKKDKEAIGIADDQVNENQYGSGYDRLDSAIPRDPSSEGPLYGR